MVGLDTSHCPAFTGMLNDASNPYHVPGAQVVGAYPGGSAQFSNSRSRVEGFTAQLRDEFGIPIYDSIPALVADVDAILLESVDGRQHLEQFQEMAAGKPVYIDKPFATTSSEAVEIACIAQHSDTPIMSCSSLRYAAGIADPSEATQDPDVPAAGSGTSPARITRNARRASPAVSRSAGIAQPPLLRVAQQRGKPVETVRHLGIGRQKEEGQHAA